MKYQGMRYPIVTVANTIIVIDEIIHCSMSTFRIITEFFKPTPSLQIPNTNGKEDRRWI